MTVFVVALLVTILSIIVGLIVVKKSYPMNEDDPLAFGAPLVGVWLILFGIGGMLFVCAVGFVVAMIGSLVG